MSHALSNLPDHIDPPRAPAQTALVQLRAEPVALDFTPEQRQMIRDTYASGASDSEFAMLFEIAKARRLNPILRQIWFVKRWDNQKGREVWAPQVSIDGLRTIAERTGLYDGQDEPEFIYDKKTGELIVAKVKVYKKGVPRPFVGVAHFGEYVQMRRDKQTKAERPNKMWTERPHIMLSKCAEALALRKAFPEDTGGLYTPEEIRDEAGAPPPKPDEIEAWGRRVSGCADMEALKTLKPDVQKLPKGPLRTFVTGLLAKRKAELERDPEQRAAEEALKQEGEPPHDPETGEVLEREEPGADG